MQKVRLTIKGLKYSEHQTGAYVVVLAEEGADRTLPIVIGGFEAQSIAIALEKEVNPPRPLSHDLFKNVMTAFGLQLLEVVILDIKDGVFFANLICQSGADIKTIDTRPSDAVSMAVRFGCPIFATELVMQKAGVILREERGPKTVSVTEGAKTSKTKKSKPDSLEDATIDQLNNMLSKALATENYELAARLRDEIDRRQ